MRKGMHRPRATDVIRHSLVAGFVCSVAVGCAAVATAFQGQSTPGVDVERLGPFVLGAAGQHSVTVVANYRDPDKGREVDGRTLTSLTILDTSGAQLFRESADPERPEEIAPNNATARAAVLVGQQRRFLLVEFYYEPSAPGGGLIYYVFGFGRSGKFRQLAKLIQDGTGLMKRRGPDGQITLAEGRYLDLGVWTSWFEMTFRYEYDGGREEFVPQNRCSAVRDLTVRRESVDEYVAARDNTILLYRRPHKGAPAEPIGVTSASKVEPLQACSSAAPTQGRVGQGTLFLQIRIDGKEGWVGESDFFRLGLQQYG